MGGGVAVSMKGDWVIHSVLYSSINSIAFHSSGTTRNGGRGSGLYEG